MPHPYLRLNLVLAASGRAPGRQELVDALQAQLRAAGHAPAGSRLPPVRVLAHQLGISRTTVHAAYGELVARGLVVSRERVGLFVSPPSSSSPAPPASRVPSPPLKDLAITHPIVAATHPRRAIVLSGVFIDPDLLPTERLQACYRSVLKQPGLTPFYHQQGYSPLRRIIAERLRRRGIDTCAEHVVITAGSQQALDCICRILSRRTVAIENPSYGIASRLLETSGLEPCPLPISPFAGVDLVDWRRRLEKRHPALLYLTTNFQNPTGFSYTSQELDEIVTLSQRLGFGVIEDDWGSEMMSFSEFRPSLRARGGDGVLYVNSFTKKLLPSLRLGYVVGNAQTVPQLVAAKAASSLGLSALNEATLFEFLDRGYYDTHLQQLQKALDQRYAACLAILRETMPEGVSWTTPGGGPSLWLEVPRRVDLPGLQAWLAQRDVLINLTGNMFLGRPHLHGTRIGYAQVPPEALRRGLELLAAGLQEQLSRRRSA